MSPRTGTGRGTEMATLKGPHSDGGGVERSPKLYLRASQPVHPNAGFSLGAQLMLTQVSGPLRTQCRAYLNHTGAIFWEM